MSSEDLIGGWAYPRRKYEGAKHFFREKEGVLTSLCGSHQLIGTPPEGFEDEAMYNLCPTCASIRAAENKTKDASPVPKVEGVPL